MEPNRDLTIAVVEQFFLHHPFRIKKLKFLDGLSGTGVRGLRLANEISFSESCQVILNDGNGSAVELIKKNIELNNLEERTVTSNENLNSLLTKTKFHFIDVDPFGSAISFIDNSVRAVQPGGLLAVTSTDTAPLCGTYPKTCMRRYNAFPLKNEFMHETGVRILMGAYARTAAKYDLALQPIILYYMDYYFRLFLEVVKGARTADKMLENIGYIIYNKSTGERYISENVKAGKEEKSIGPLWIGPLNDKGFVKSLNLSQLHLKTKKQLMKVCQLWLDESEMPPWFYDINMIASKLKIQPKKVKDIKNRMEKSGFPVVQTHFSPQGFKTSAGISEIRDNLK